MTTFGTIPLGAIVPSPTNPRKTFDPARLQELADSIKASGVHQPVLLRPLPAQMLADTAHMKPRPDYELVAGERRYRASLMAGQDTIPAMIRELTDAQTLEVQILENLQRDDLTALEEAHGYQQLMDHAQIGAEDVAVRIGKSRSYVFGRLKLLDMGQDCREALRTGLIDASKALLLARIPSTALQARALQEIIRPNHPEGVMNHRMAQEHIRSRYMLKIEQAVFDHTDASLAPRACTICPTRTGADADLFMDVMGADMCTDPDCYNNKVQQHHSRRRAELEAQGHQIIDGQDAKAIMPSAMHAPEGYARLDVLADSPTNKPLREELAKLIEKGDVMPVMIVNPHKDGDLIACVPEDQVARLLERAGRKKAAEAAKEARDRADKLEAGNREVVLRNEFERTWRLRALGCVVDAVKKDPETELPKWATTYMAEQLLQSMDVTVKAELVKMLGLAVNEADETDFDMNPVSAALLAWAADLNNGVTPADKLVVLSAANGSHWYSWLNRDEAGAETMVRPLLSAFSKSPIMLADIKAEVQGEITARETDCAQKAAEADLPAQPAAQATGVRGKAEAKGAKDAKGKKTQGPAGAGAPLARISVAEAMQGIAAAMQGVEGAQAPHAGLGTNPGADAQHNDAAVRHADSGPDGADVADGQTSRPQPNSDEAEDALIEQAQRIVVETQAVSVRLLKLRLGVGTDRAMKVVSQLELRGVVTACDERGVRKVLVET